MDERSETSDPIWTRLKQRLQQLRLVFGSGDDPKDESLGNRGERKAAKFLKRLGYRIVERGARGPLGEIDLVAIDGRTVVFVEVKTRKSHDRGHPADAVHTEKQRRLTRLALAYLRNNDLLEVRARFDIIAITWSDESKEPTIEHYINAFEPHGQGQMFG